MTVRTFTVLDPSTYAELKQRIAAACEDKEVFEVTAIEQLDELASRRQTAQPEKFQLKLFSIHFGAEGHITCYTDDGSMARIDRGDASITLTLVSSGEFSLANP